VVSPSSELQAWLTVDYNTQPNEATYQLLVNPHNPLPVEISQDIIDSRFVHKSLDKLYSLEFDTVSAVPSNSGTGTATPVVNEKEDGEGEGEAEGEGELPDNDERSVAGTRDEQPSDGIATMEDLVRMAKEMLPDTGCQSAYEAGKWTSAAGATFNERDGFKRSFTGRVPDGMKGHAEPAYTCYTPLFKLTLGESSYRHQSIDHQLTFADYLLVLPAPNVQITQVLRPGTAEELGDGLPRKGICASDHIAVGCEISW